MLNILLIFIGAGLGGVSRYGVSNFTYWIIGRQFPYGTLFVNASGSFLIGLLFVVIMGRYSVIGPQLRSFLLIGFLGGYTTFSSFSLETINMFESGAWVGGVLNILLNVLICISLTWIGVLGGRQL
ncbi:MAG: fluoride efflux transporter CrcB [Legionellaceae bacterium]|nr:fluoride efflux transporter CrcB [Legionellaceae bacterium]